MKICVIIPCFNEERSIGYLVREVIAQDFDVLVVDDGSRDNSVAVAKAAGAIVLTATKNQGKGAALQKGFKFSLRHNYEAVITMDADGQHDPQDLKVLVEEAKRRSSKLVVGNRMSFYKNMPTIRILTNKFMSLLISLLCQQDIPDSQCGYRLISCEVLKNIKLFTSNYEIESEILVAAARKTYRIDSVPIKTIYAGERSQINPFIDTIRFFKFVFRQLFRRK